MEVGGNQMEWYSRRKKATFAEPLKEESDALPEEVEKILKESDGRVMVVRRKSIWRLSLKMFGRYCCMFLLSLFMIGIFTMIGNSILEIAMSILIFLVLTIFIYMGMWAEGYQDKNFVMFSGLKMDRWRGLTIGLITSIPIFINYVLFFVSKIQNSQEIYTGFGWAMMPFTILLRIFIPSGYVSDANLIRTILVCLIPVYYIGIYVMGYLFGFSGKKILKLKKETDIQI